MDEVLQKFENVVVESQDDSKSNFENLYKNWGKFSNQEERRRDILDSQKKGRSDKIDHFRGILDLVKAVEDTSLFQSKTYYTPKLFVAGFMRESSTFNNLLMLSEWMIEKPEDFHENWFVVPCPKGRRLLVVASQGVTKYFTKYGQFKFQNYTALPGGNPFDSRGKNTCCVLDCVYDELKKTMYILDLLVWNNLPMTDGELDFRNYWLQMNVPEITELKEIDTKNNVIFTLLPKVPCNKESFNEFMMKCPHFENDYPLLDGLLFYHKQGQYLPGKTPIVGWLYPFMVTEILGSDITVNNTYLLSKPKDYVNQADFIEKFESKAEFKVKKHKQKRNSTISAMETTDTLERTNQCMDKRASSVSSQAQADAGDEMEVPNEIADQEQTE